MVLSLTHSFLSISSSVRDHRDEDGVVAVGVEADAEEEEEEEEEEAREPKILSTRTLKLSSMAGAGFKEGRKERIRVLTSYTILGVLRMRSFWSFDYFIFIIVWLRIPLLQPSPFFFYSLLDAIIRRVVLFKPSLVESELRSRHS